MNSKIMSVIKCSWEECTGKGRQRALHWPVRWRLLRSSEWRKVILYTTKMSPLVNQAETQSEGPRLPHRTAAKCNYVFPNFKMGLKFCEDFFQLRKHVSTYRKHERVRSSMVTLLFYLLVTSSLAEASLRHSSSSLLNLIGLQQSVSSVASFASPVAAALSTSSQSLLPSTSFNAKLHNGKWQIAGKSAFFWKLR